MHILVNVCYNQFETLKKILTWHLCNDLKVGHRESWQNWHLFWTTLSLLFGHILFHPFMRKLCTFSIICCDPFSGQVDVDCLRFVDDDVVNFYFNTFVHSTCMTWLLFHWHVLHTRLKVIVSISFYYFHNGNFTLRKNEKTFILVSWLLHKLYIRWVRSSNGSTPPRRSLN